MLEKPKKLNIQKQKELLNLKVQLVGDPACGKSSIVERFINNSFNNNYCPTVGIDYKNRILEEKDSLININCWDLSGDNNYQDIRLEFYKESYIIFIVFDLQYKKTLDSCQGWMAEAMEHGAKEGAFFLIGNKAEDKVNRNVKEQDAKQIAQKLKARYFEVSAKDNINIDKLFNEVIKSLD